MNKTNVKCTRKITVAGLCVCKKTTAKCSASGNAAITVKSTFVELDTLAGGGASSLSWIYVDQRFGDVTPDGTLVRITGKTGVTAINCNELGNIIMDGVTVIDIKPTTVINFIWVSAQAKWVWCSGDDTCSIC
jgi:hypothetical protein